MYRGARLYCHRTDGAEFGILSGGLEACEVSRGDDCVDGIHQAYAWDGDEEMVIGRDGLVVGDDFLDFFLYLMYLDGHKVDHLMHARNGLCFSLNLYLAQIGGAAADTQIALVTQLSEVFDILGLRT